MRATLEPVRLRSPRTALPRPACQPIRFGHEHDFSASYQLMTELMRLLRVAQRLSPALRRHSGYVTADRGHTRPPHPLHHGTPVKSRVLTQKRCSSPHPSCFQENGWVGFHHQVQILTTLSETAPRRPWGRYCKAAFESALVAMFLTGKDTKGVFLRKRSF